MEDFNSLESNIKSALVSTVRSANSLANEDLPFQRSLDSKVGPALDQQNARLLSLAERLVGAATSNTEIVRPPRLKDLDSVEGNWRAVVDVVDSLLERADTALDEFTGAVKRLSPGVEQVGHSREVSTKGDTESVTRQMLPILPVLAEPTKRLETSRSKSRSCYSIMCLRTMRPVPSSRCF